MPAVAALVAVPALAAPFDGPFIGIQGGWQQDRSRLSVIDDGFGGTAHDRSSSFSYGGQIGYDRQLTPQIVVGGEVSATGETRDSRRDDGFRLGIGRTVNATARLGYLVTPTSLVYVRGGYTNARFDLNDTLGRSTQNRDGYTAGIGYEQALTPNVSARVEYNYSDYRRRGVRDVAYDIGADDVRADYRRNAVTAGLNYHF